MPGFGFQLSDLSIERKLSPNELIYFLRRMVDVKYEAVQLHKQLADSIDDLFCKSALMDIADEELVHAGKFQRILFRLAPD